ncbi:MAG: hypothetical protein EOO43_14455 [Flavobacterium sp.]|nr:MAG: hypothetical protein EOO43_14455 [Flavobacterium sp.]
MGRLLADQHVFDEFAKKVLGRFAKDEAKLTLRNEVAKWYEPYHAIVKGSLLPSFTTICSKT